VKIVSSHYLSHAAGNHALGHLGVFARLAQKLDMDLNQFRKASDTVVPFVRQPVSPTALHWASVEFLSHHLFDATFIRGGVEIEIGALRFYCGLSPKMAQCCWYQTNVATLARYARNMIRHFVHDPDKELICLLQRTEGESQSIVV